MIPIPLNLIGPLAGAVVAIALLGGAYFKGSHDANTKWEAEAAASKIAAQQQEAAWAESMERVRIQHEKDKSLVQSRLTIALNGLRDRPAIRLPEAARAACVGATGSELSRPDSEFLIREAARADSLAGDLRACKAYINTITKK
jgi:ribosomal protein S11